MLHFGTLKHTFDVRASKTVYIKYLNVFALLFRHLLTLFASGVGHLTVFLIFCLTLLFALGNAHLDIYRLNQDDVSVRFPLPPCELCNIWVSHDAHIFCHKPRRRCHPRMFRNSDIPEKKIPVIIWTWLAWQ